MPDLVVPQRELYARALWQKGVILSSMTDMHILQIHDPATALRAAEVLRAGGVVLFPTDTLYCLGADALSNAAVDTLFTIKKRDPRKPIHALVSDLAMASRYGVLNELGQTILARAPKGKVSLVVQKLPSMQQGIMRSIDSFGFRIPDHLLTQAILSAFGGPITATSANTSGEQPPRQDLDSILAQMGSSASLIGLAIDGGMLGECLPSTVVDVSNGEALILREGAVRREDI